jgi:hypothetical protein
MKQIGTTTEGNVIVEMTEQDITRIDEAIATITESAGKVGLLLAFRGQTQAEQYAEVTGAPVVEVVNVTPPPPAKVKAKVKAKVQPKTKAARHNYKSAIMAVMAGKGPMAVADVVAAYVASNGIAATKDIAEKIGKSLPSNPDVFERTGRAIYKVREAAVKTKPAPDMSLFNLDPATLDDEQLSRRLHQAKQLGRSDNAARMEFIKRKATA